MKDNFSGDPSGMFSFGSSIYKLTKDSQITYILRPAKQKCFTACRETGDFIEPFDSIEDAGKAIEKYESDDKNDGTYVEDFYDVVDSDHMSLSKPENRGGFRPNSGRPRKGSARLVTYVKPSTASQIAEISEELGITRGEVIDNMVESHVEQAKKE